MQREDAVKKMESLQFLRGISVLAVVLFHIKGFSAMVGGNDSTIFKYIPHLFGHGALLFFGISGFLMALLIDTGYKNFLYRRFIRIYPPYLIAVVGVLFVKLLVFGSVSQSNLLKSLTLLPFGSIPYTLNIEWTLVYEIFFYLICALFAWKFKDLFLYFLFVWFAVIFVTNLTIDITPSFLPTITQIPFQTLNYFFIFGGLTYYLTKTRHRLSNRIIYILIPIVLGVVFSVYYFVLISTPYLEHLVLSILFSLFIYLVVISNFNPSKLLNKLGDRSYGMYLLHAQVMVILLMAFKDLYRLPINSFTVSIILCITIIMGWFFGDFEMKLHTIIKKVKFNDMVVRRVAVALCIITFVSLSVDYVRNIPIVDTVEASKETIDLNNAGWIDSISSEKVKRGKKILLNGWAINPEEVAPAKDLILFINGEIIPIDKIKWSPRDGIAELFGSSGVIECGWELTLDTGSIDIGNYQLEVYAIIKDGKQVKLNSNINEISIVD